MLLSNFGIITLSPRELPSNFLVQFPKYTLKHVITNSHLRLTEVLYKLTAGQ